MKKSSYRLAAIIAAIILALAGVVYAAATEWNMLQFFQDRYEMNLTDETKKTIVDNVLDQSLTLSDITFTFREAVADGRFLYATIQATPDVSLSAYFMEPGIDPTDPMVFGGMYTYDKDDGRSFQSAAQAEDKRLFTVQAWADAEGYEVLGGYTDAILEADGSLSLIIGMELPLPKEETVITLTMTAFAAEWLPDRDGIYERAEPVRDTLTFTLPVALPTAEVKIEVDQVVPGTAAHIDTFTLTMTPLSCYYEIAYTALETEDTLLNAHTRHSLFFDLLNEKGEVLPFGLSMTASKDSADDIHYTQTGCFQVAELPTQITLRPNGNWGGGPLDILTLDIPHD